MNATEQKPDVITSGTGKKSCGNECESTGSQWAKECPRCHRIQTYSDKWKLQRALKFNTQCFKCCNAIVLEKDSYTKQCPSCGSPISYKSRKVFYSALSRDSQCSKCAHEGINVGRKMLDETKKKLSKLATQRGGHPHTDAHKTRICGSGNPMYGVHRYDNLNPFYGKRHTEESRRKMRVAMCQKVLQMNRGGMGRLVNIGAGEKQYFDQLEKENGWFGNRQHFVSHLGYFVDYYEPYYNIVVEYDEPRHYRHGRLREKDLMRMEQIKTHLGCEFWRWDSYRKELTKYF